MNDRLLSNDAKFWRINLDNLELDLSHPSTTSECVALSNGSVGLAEIWS